jgi:hypothetical protein
MCINTVTPSINQIGNDIQVRLNMRKYFLPTLAVSCLVCSSLTLQAESLCVKQKVTKRNLQHFGRAIVVTTGSCPNGFKLLTTLSTSDTAGATGAKGDRGDTGATGATGAPGEPGQNGAIGSSANLEELVYGVEGGEDITYSNTTGQNTYIAPTIPYRNITINNNVTLVVPSGSTVRCTGTFTNNGTIVSFDDYANEGGSAAAGTSDSTTIDVLRSNYRPNLFGTIASNGEVGRAGGTISGGSRSRGLTFQSEDLRIAETIWNPPGTACGLGGMGGRTPSDCGGSFRIISKEELVNNGEIQAHGRQGSIGAGGSSGGIVILASKVSVINTGSIDVRGGNGGSSSSDSAAGGGGGGGLIRMIAPIVNSQAGGDATINVDGGSAGFTVFGQPVSATVRFGGGAGGALIGDGGFGGTINSDGSLTNGSDPGGEGLIDVLQTDPTNPLLQHLSRDAPARPYNTNIER